MKLIYIILGLCIIQKSLAVTCTLTCGRSGNCSELSYFLANCAQCPLVREKCSTDFCHNHPNLCENGKPLKDLSINTRDVRDDKIHDVCLARLFPEMMLVGLPNGDLNISNLNTLDITTFAQTRGDPKRNLGIIKKLMANYLVYQKPELKNDRHLETLVEQELTRTYLWDIDQLTLPQYHTIAQDLREKIFNLKGIKTKLRTESYNGQTFPMTVSNMGCTGETSSSQPPRLKLNPLRVHPRVDQAPR